MTGLKNFIAFTLCIGTALAFTTSIEMLVFGIGFLPIALREIIGELERNCDRNVTDIDFGWRSARECFDEFVPSAGQSICQSLENNIERCTQPAIDYIDECIPEKSRDLPPAIIKTAKAILHAVCSNTGEILLEVFNSCLYKIEEAQNLLGDDCDEKVLKRKVEALGKMPSKTEVCQVVREVGVCWKSTVEYTCKSPKTIETFSLFYTAAQTFCE